MGFRKSWHETIPVNLYDPYQVVFSIVAVGRITWLPLALSHLREYFVITIRYWIDVFSMFIDNKHTLLITWNNIECKILVLADSSLTQTLLLDSALFDTKTNTLLTQTMTWQVWYIYFVVYFQCHFSMLILRRSFLNYVHLISSESVITSVCISWRSFSYRFYSILLDRKLHYCQYVLNCFRNFFWKFYCLKSACFFISSGLCFPVRFQHTEQSLGKTPKKRMKV